MFLLISFLYNFTLDNSNHVISGWHLSRKKPCTDVRNIELISKQPSQVFVFTFLSLQFKFRVHSCLLCCLIAFPSHPFAYFLTSGYLLQTPDNSELFSTSLEGSSYTCAEQNKSTIFLFAYLHNTDICKKLSKESLPREFATTEMLYNFRL